MTSLITGFSSTNSQKNVARVLMSFITSDIITLSDFSINQLIQGVSEYKPNIMIESEVVILLSKLYNETLGNPTLIQIPVTRKEVQLLRQWLEQRMLHCEKEREAENNNTNMTEYDKHFNPDSYITMKLLLIELHEWLLGEEVQEVSIPKSYKDYQD